MDIKFYYNNSDDRKINKVISHETLFQGNLKEATDIMNPIITFDKSEILRFNYCYIPDFQRYYFVTNVSAYGVHLYDVSLTCDVLMSFRSDITRLNCIVNRQTMEANGDEYIDDGSLVTENVYFKEVFNYQNGFNNTPSYILITAG